MSCRFALTFLLLSIPISASAQELVPAGSINAALGGPKQIIVTQDDPVIKRFAHAVHKQFFRNADFIDDKQALERRFAGVDVVVYGTPQHAWLRRLTLPFSYEENAVVLDGRRFEGKRLRVICAIRNPDDPERRAVLYTAAKADDVADINAVFHGPTEWVVADGTRTLAAGSFLGPALPVKQLVADLDELAAKIKSVHPAAIDGLPGDMEATTKKARSELTAPRRRARFWLVLSQVMHTLHDAHSAVEPVRTGEMLDLPFLWTSEGMIVTSDAGAFRKGDRIVRLGTLTELKLLELLRGVIPAENDHWVRHRAENVLRDLGFLRTLGIADKAPVKAAVDRSGKDMELTASVAATAAAGSRPPWVRFEIDESSDLGIFVVDQCINNDLYKDRLRKFFQAVRQKKISRIAVDVRRNSGGNSTVINEFLRYIDVGSYRVPGSIIRWSEEARARQTGLAKLASGVMRYDPRTVKNARVEEAFRGQVFVLTSKATFSSGNWFAVFVQDNKIGKVLGEPTGNSPSSYGDMLSFTLPHSGLSYSLSFKRWLRPDPKRDPANCVTPDQLLATTRRDVIEGRDPVLDYLRKAR
ncbi:MAG: S41 family peptidase [Gemmataceae bacterium]|nr:S41 family peptidase [Gemmataceae bacterium]MCI0739057.1 S41 family peptidase [Gemmataceae bacterium]